MARTTATWIRGRTIGRGAFGTVSLAFGGCDGSDGVFAVKSVALNCAGRASVLALDNEIQILKSLSSPYVVEYLGHDTTEEPPSRAWRNLHMEYLPGGTAADLAAAARRRNGCGLDEVALRAYARRAARALCYLHGVAGVVHCDVKGRNLLLGREPGVAKLADFGAAVRISDGNERDRAARGTPLWMAPEVARGERPRPESDVWSLGCTVIEMATGAQPWANWSPKDAAEAMFRIGYGDELPEFPIHLSKLGRDFLAKCLRREASERWTAEQLLHHPFLSEAEALMEQSPRGVLDWANSEFIDEDHRDCNGSETHNGDSDSISLVDCAKERMAELASSCGILAWDSDGWERVRSADEVFVKRRSRGEKQEECWEHTNSCSVSSEDNHGNLSDQNESELSTELRFSSSSSCLCCCSEHCVCVCELSTREHDSLFEQMMDVNRIQCSLSFGFALNVLAFLIFILHHVRRTTTGKYNNVY
ncbi:hypothetical protein Cni_G15609 [Canna indica]|uniref:Protein kinase domain-containing protein n=1 Tax=Canna indica TaxID=4628 RepID=A0AAQ3KGF0_9LILI|nr:hypothetical protein Cni_G15609 [Canna indica]